jgi:kumamolisin
MAIDNVSPILGRRPAPPAESRQVAGGLQVTAFLRRRQPLLLATAGYGILPRERTYLNLAELHAQHGSAAADLARVEAFARTQGLRVIVSDLGSRRVVLEGGAAQLGAAFGVEVVGWNEGGRNCRACRHPVEMPAELHGVVLGVFGFDNRPVAKSHLRRKPVPKMPSFAGYTGSQVAAFYNFPIGVDGTGETIGIIELGGGFKPADIATYFLEIGVPAPSVTAVPVDGGTNAPTTPDSADGEVLLDIEVAGAVAPGAKIVVYFAAGATDQDFLNAISAAVHDSVNNPSVISISWGGPESASDASFQTQFDEILQSAAALGITVTVASGDSGAADEPPTGWDGNVHVDFPASSPHALGCGGTAIRVSGTSVTAESIWNEDVTSKTDTSFGASGGGISEVFPVPAFQAGVKLPANASTGGTGRGVPDVAGDGDPDTGYRVRVDGQEFPVGGTSAVAPLWAGLVALLNQKLGKRVGFLNSLLYAHPECLVPVTVGNNQVGPNHVGYVAGPGWNACAGLGRPDGAKILAMLSG